MGFNQERSNDNDQDPSILSITFVLRFLAK